MPNLTVERLRPLQIVQDDEFWELGIVELPAEFLDSEGNRQRQLACVVCVSSEGGAAMSAAGRRSDIPDSSAVDALASFALDPHVPEAPPLNFLPSRVVIGSGADTMPDSMREHLMASMDALGIQVEVKSVLSNLDEFREYISSQIEMSEPLDAPSIAKPAGMTIDRIRAFADAAATFFDVAPWRYFPTEVVWIIEPRPRTRALRCCSVMGFRGEEYGLGFFSNPRQLLSLPDEVEIDFDDPSVPTALWSMTFDPIDEAPRPDVELWAAHDLPLAHHEAFPVPGLFSIDQRVRRPKPTQLTLMEALLRGFAGVDEDQCQGDELEFDVDTFDGRTSLRLRCGVRL